VAGHKKQFCVRGHDTSIVGRNEKRICNGCRKPVSLNLCPPKPKKQFCINGHDVNIVGRDANGGGCNQCKKDRHPLPTGHPKTQFCPKGHNKDVVGRNKDGSCKKCKKESHLKWLDENKDLILKWSRQYSKEHKEEIAVKSKQWHINNPEYQNEYYNDNKIRINARVRKYYKNHPEIRRLYNLTRHTKRKLRIPKWGQENIKEFYTNCPKNRVVDHIIPLCGKLISGLHVSWNLQYLTPKQNRKKNNNVDLIEVSEWYGQILQQAGLK
jgi:hypothetical protein